jgi:membrane protein YdbS with pleckstrin-like domain
VSDEAFPEWQRQDPRKVDLDRTVGWIVTAVLSFGLLITTGVLSLTADSRWLALVLGILWLPFTLAIGLLSYQWPTLDYRWTRYRVDDEVVEIERGVVFRSSVTVPRPRVQHLDVSQGPIQRYYGLGVLSIYTAGTEHSVVALPGLAHDVALALRDRLLPKDAKVDGV